MEGSLQRRTETARGSPCCGHRVCFQVPSGKCSGKHVGSARLSQDWGGARPRWLPQTPPEINRGHRGRGVTRTVVKRGKSENGLWKAHCYFFLLSTFSFPLSPVTYPITPLLIFCLRPYFLYLVLLQAVHVSLPSESVLAGRPGTYLML